jgi:hypothetical protein
MTVRQHSWTQRTWERAGQSSYDRVGDFYDLNGLFPHPKRTRLLRAPAFDSHTAWPNDFQDPEGAFFDLANAYYVFLGKQTSDDHLASAYYEQDWTAHGPNDLTIDVSAYGALQGYSRRNLRYWGGKYYLITDNWDVYAGSSYESAPSKLWDATGGLSARLLFAYGDRIYFVDNQGTVYRIDTAGTAFDSYHDMTIDLDIRYATPFHQYFALISRADDGTLSLLRLPDVNPLIVHEVAALLNATGREPYATPFTDGSLYATHRDRVYFTSGWYVPDDSTTLDVYAFNGSRIEHVAQLRDLPTYANTRAAGLDVWHDELVFWYVRTDTNNQQIRMLVGDGFVTFCEQTAPASDYSCLYPLNGELILVAKSGSTEGFYKTSGKQDGYLISSWLDFGHPAKTKRLDRLECHVDTADADLDIILKYRADDATAWTTAATCTDTKIPSADPSGVEFKRLQLRVDIDDDSGSDLDVAIETLSCLYSVDT